MSNTKKKSIRLNEKAPKSINSQKKSVKKSIGPKKTPDIETASDSEMFFDLSVRLEKRAPFNVSFSIRNINDFDTTSGFKHSFL